MRQRQRGIALMIVTVTIAVLSAVVGDFSYNARVDLEAAANARDQLRAEYLARSGIALSRLLIKVQQSVLDANRKFVGDIQISEFAPYLIKAFGGDADERAGLGSLLGIDTSSMKGLGVGKGGTFDVAMTHDDGRLNLNCGGGLADNTKQQQLYGILGALFWPPRYNRIFEKEDADGQFYTRDEVSRAILDWADIDENRFEPPPNTSTGAENYRYDSGRDPFRAHNHLYDTIEELNLVRGVGDELWGSFGDMFTVYGSCKVNVGSVRPEHWPLVAAILRATVTDEEKNNPALFDDVLLAQLAQRVISSAQMTGGFQSVQQFIQVVGDPASALQIQGGTSPLSGSTTPPPSSSQPGGQAVGLKLDPNKVNQVVTIGPRRIYRIDSVGSIQRTKEKKIQVHIRAIWDTTHYNQNTTSADINDRQGTWIYWRED
jgi:type II secretory pathway component PulK